MDMTRELIQHIKAGGPGVLDFAAWHDLCDLALKALVVSEETKVYVVTCRIAYEGESVEAAYATREAAEKHPKNKNADGMYIYDMDVLYSPRPQLPPSKE